MQFNAKEIVDLANESGYETMVGLLDGFSYRDEDKPDSKKDPSSILNIKKRCTSCRGLRLHVPARAHDVAGHRRRLRAHPAYQEGGRLYQVDDL